MSLDPSTNLASVFLSDSRSRSGAPSSRLLAAISIGILAAVFVHAHGAAQPSFKSDFDQVWAATRALLAGRDPYSEIGPTAPFTWKWPLYYPLPALLITTPLAALSVLYARMVFAGVSAGVFAWAITRDGWSRWPILLSVTFYVSVDLVQWSPLLASAFFIPALGAIGICKPNFMLPIATSVRSRRDLTWILLGALVLVVASFLVEPGWLNRWLTNVRSAPHFKAPLTRPFGFLLLLAALRWRRPEARWLLGLSLIPQAPSFYDQLLLVGVCQRWWETSILAAGTYALFFLVQASGPQLDYAAWGGIVGNATVWLCYLPCLVMVLRRPNGGSVGPHLLDNRLSEHNSAANVLRGEG